MIQQQMLMQDPAMMFETLGLDPMNGFKKVSPEGIVGQFDFIIDAESSAQTISMRREQVMSLYSMAGQDPYFKPLPIRKKVVEIMGFKDTDTYLYSEQQVQMMQQAAAEAQASEPAPGEEEGSASEQ